MSSSTTQSLPRLDTYGRPPDDLTAGWACKKRDGTVVPFTADKIRKALSQCFAAVGLHAAVPGGPGEVADITERVTRRVVNTVITDRVPAPPDVETVQRYVIRQLWAEGLFAAAEHYQNYREERRKLRELETSTVFGRRTAFKPFEYPDATQFKEAIQKSFWTVKEFDPISDVQDYRTAMTPAEQSACARTLLAIAQIEVNVKRFWTKLGDRIPKAEFEQVGVVFGDSEVRHADAYSRALDVLGLNGAFAMVTDVPAIKSRIEYLTAAMREGIGGSDRAFAKVLAVFSLLVENVSLFSQFVVMRAFYQQNGRMKNVDNIVQATIKEEAVHAAFGAWLCNLIKAEKPEWFGPKFRDDLRATCLDAYRAEGRILDWIFEAGPVPAVSRPALDAFLKDRINQGVVMVGCDPVFDTVGPDLAELDWFVRELTVPVQVDFFWKKATTYTGNDTEVSAATMWD